MTSNDCNTDHNQEGKQLQHTQIFDPQHKTDVHECNVFIMLLSDGGDSQSGFSENPMKIDKESNWWLMQSAMLRQRERIQSLLESWDTAWREFSTKVQIISLIQH